MIIDNLRMTRNMQDAKLYAFCILPDHMHILLSPGTKGLSAFVHSFKRNTMRDVRKFFAYETATDSPCQLLPAAEVRNLRTVYGSGRYGSSAAGNNDRIEVDDWIVGWQKSFHDERIRDARQCSTAFGYIQGNGMKHGLVAEIEDWPWSSLHFPEIIDPCDVWL